MLFIYLFVLLINYIKLCIYYYCIVNARLLFTDLCLYVFADKARSASYMPEVTFQKFSLHIFFFLFLDRFCKMLKGYVII